MSTKKVSIQSLVISNLVFCLSNGRDKWDEISIDFKNLYGIPIEIEKKTFTHITLYILWYVPSQAVIRKFGFFWFEQSSPSFKFVVERQIPVWYSSSHSLVKLLCYNEVEILKFASKNVIKKVYPSLFYLHILWLMMCT